MSNVLPAARVSALRTSTRAKFVLAAGFILSAAALAGIIALMPAYFLAYFPRLSPSEQAGNPESDVQRRIDQETAMRIRTLLTEVTAITKEKSSPIDIIADAYAQKPASITFAGATYTKGEPATITLVGFAKTRDDVSTYRDTLAKDERFKSVSVPVAALVGALAGNFTITISGDF